MRSRYGVGAEQTGVTRRRVALGEVSINRMVLPVPACYRIRISASVVLSSLGSIRGGPVGIGRARRRRIASQHVMWVQARRCAVQLGSGPGPGPGPAEKKREREGDVAVEIRKG